MWILLCLVPTVMTLRTEIIISILPCQVAEVGVYGAANNLAANVAKLLNPVAEGNDLSGTHKCEVQGVEEEDDILPCDTKKTK